MKVAIMQPYLFPYLGYWQLINAVDIFVIYDDVNYIKGGFINRNYIQINRKPFLFTLSLKKASSNKLINEIEVGDNKEKLLKTIKLNYKKAPNFHNIYDLIADIILNPEKNLSKYVAYSIFKISEYLDIKTKFMFSSEIPKNKSAKGQEKIIEICKILNATVYINSIGGINLYKKEDFKKEGILLKFLKPGDIKYKQWDDNKFIPNLSIIDVLMFNKKDEIKDMLTNYTLV